MALPPKWYQFLVGVFASLGSFLFGYDLGVIAEVIQCDTFKARFGTDSAKIGAVVSTFTGGGFIGALIAGYISDWLGRRITISVATVIFLVGGSLQTAAQSLAYLWSGRAITGAGVGILVMIVPLYQAELAHPSIRGRITALQQFMLGIGALLATWSGYGTYIHLTNEGQWRIPLALQMVPAIVLGTCIFFMPESPRWLIDNGKTEQGLAVLAQLHANGDQMDPFVRAEFEAIQTSITIEHDTEAKKWSQLITDKLNFKRLFIAVSVQGSIQMTGVSFIQYYAPSIFAQIGISTSTTLLLQAINSIIALIAQFCCIMFIDRFGRRWVLIIGNLVNMVAWIIVTALVAEYGGQDNANGAHWAFIIMTWLYQFSFSFACGPLSWIIPAEIFNTATRSKGVAIATMTSFATNTLIGQVSPIALEDVGWKYFVFFIVANFTNAIFFYCILPETSRVPLENMDQLFDSSWWVPGWDKEHVMRLREELEERTEEIREKDGNAAEHVETAP
ncbi:hypothetical protein H072_3306 [Dactylellina haptotyla CBS 200.50]|uniref:Major facilitator superfamily (MFS) profile domain-containing protein n=1 Tax=Dactylellina haptotyla (strain CBS 200.50) TaxID=1284197 RepID=S8C4U1_DACHA|nr:hypothetical protein H072_3306 [Dactylellina haptotyla CBS 200.50]